MQPYLFPYIGYFQLLNAADKFVIFDDVNFINKGWVNRNNLLVNGKSNLFTIPLNKSSSNKLIKNIGISNQPNWKLKFLKTIQRSYSKAEFFPDVYPMISEIMENTDKDISGLIYESLTSIKNYLDITTEIIETSSIYLNSVLKKQERIIDICKKENATDYYNLSGGMHLYSKELFLENGIDLHFIKPKEISYKQFTDNFVPSLSIIDVLMFNSKDAVKKLLNEYELHG